MIISSFVELSDFLIDNRLVLFILPVFAVLCLHGFAMNIYDNQVNSPPKNLFKLTFYDDYRIIYKAVIITYIYLILIILLFLVGVVLKKIP